MTEPDLNLIGERLLAIQTDMRGMREDITAMRAGIAELSDGQTVLTQMVFRLERDMVGVKGMLDRMDSRIAHLEKAAP